MVIRVFVYGTLMRGGCYHKQFLKGHKFIGPGVITGYALYGLGSYPGVVPEKGERVKGEVYGIDWTALREIDILEDNGSLYHRKRVRVLLEDDSIRAYVYIYNGSVKPENKIHYDDQPWKTAHDNQPGEEK